MIIYLSLLVALVGAGLIGFAANPKLVKIGEIFLFCGLLAFLLGLPGHPLGLIPR